MDLNGVSAIVTGGASGLGAATVQVLAQSGVICTIFDVDGESAAKTAQTLGADSAEVDVTKEASVQWALDRAHQRHGPARILVNCAGIGIATKTVSKGEAHCLDEFRRIIDVNLLGTFNCLRLMAAQASALTPLADNERAVIVNTASIAAFDGQIGQAAYSASKAGIVGMTLPIARDLAKLGIRICTIAPGLFHTPAMDILGPLTVASLGNMIPFPDRLGAPEEFAQLVRHICENKMLNGETIRLDGALRMPPRN